MSKSFVQGSSSDRDGYARPMAGGDDSVTKHVRLRGGHSGMVPWRLGGSSLRPLIQQQLACVRLVALPSLRTLSSFHHSTIHDRLYLALVDSQNWQDRGQPV